MILSLFDGIALHGLTPTPGMTLWLKGDSVVGTDGSSLASFPDSSGGAHNAIQATGANQPILKTGLNGLNGLNVVRFDGAASFMSGTFPVSSSNTGFCIYYVVRTGPVLSGQGGQAIVLGSGASATAGVRWGFGCGASGAAGAGWGGAAADVNLGAVSGIAINKPFYGRYKNNKSSWSLDGISSGTFSDTSFFTGTTFTYYLGNELTNSTPYWFNGDIAEIIIYTRLLTPTEDAATKAYLFAKWNLS